MYCDRIQKPWEALARRISELDFIEVKAASSFGGQEIQGYPHFQLFEDGRLQNYVAGAEIERLKSAVAALRDSKKPRLHGDDDLVEGRVYYVHDKSERQRYVGQTYQPVEKRWAQEAGAYGHNEPLNDLFHSRGVQREVIDTRCVGHNKEQVRDCLDFLERQEIERLQAHKSFPGGLNNTRGNAGRSAKLGYDYGACLAVSDSDSDSD
jgi:hypothetical protein